MDWFEKNFDKLLIGFWVAGAVVSVSVAAVVVWGIVRLVSFYTGG
jgi:hypothetical protein